MNNFYVVEFKNEKSIWINCLKKYFHNNVYISLFDKYFYENKKLKLCFVDRVSIQNEFLFKYGESNYCIYFDEGKRINILF